MPTFKQYLAEEVIISPVTAKRPKMAAGGSDRARNMLASAINNTDRDCRRLMAVDNGLIVGAVSYYTGRDKWIIDRIGSLQKGVGTQLMQRVIELAKKAKVARLELWATETSDTFYDRFGFEDSGNTSVGKGHKLLDLTT